MKRNLQEGRKDSERKVIYEGNGFAKVIENGRVVERIQFERGDNLMESFGGRSLTEGRYVGNLQDSIALEDDGSFYKIESRYENPAVNDRHMGVRLKTAYIPNPDSDIPAQWNKKIKERRVGVIYTSMNGAKHYDIPYEVDMTLEVKKQYAANFLKELNALYDPKKHLLPQVNKAAKKAGLEVVNGF